MRALLLTATFLAGLMTGQAGDGAPASRPAVGVLVEQTRGADRDSLAAARAEVRRLEASGVAVELRVTRSPSESVGAASTLAARGADRLVTYDAAPAPLAPLRDHLTITAR